MRSCDDVSACKYPRLYPQLDEAIRAKGKIIDFIRWAHLGETTYFKMQSGHTIPGKATIDVCLDYTGLTYEEAFR